MQQRFSNNEIKKQNKPAKIMTTSDMLTHPWILVTEDDQKVGANKKKSSKISD